ncbi:hypothetical protein MA4S0726RB_4217 [Mycobacteroides abscessus 4S-0726-RB]|nr:hypothetical protein MA4S0303_4687 [Mycobacteroides abscessus 4S-0303]EIT92881.1 hypothetical protein MA4S0726RB_4217 [Mycobacteroides abscessus 4S-0726-RB]EIT96426.1 hypothetical protein MA4S0726RA_4623 [Mycobacteroides abscessus 4S-0726-RA]EIV07612.1 hypothetical protein MA4S0206_4692 [Mycobacteroides abscessus 4S-0206]EIV47462.1 hypothetical protein MA4S0116R_4643 [Mycobacteroides abscessus 4S-0116-R]EIV60860.1 hypothetical protein MA4S0116S_3762 [Mycobacteroides abscessus 4S-0116-S]
MTTEEYVEALVGQAPPLSGEQRDKLAELLRPVRDMRAVA